MSIAELMLGSLPSTCTDMTTMISNQSCDFYTDCLEAKFQCGPDGYPIGYGYKYCDKFLEEYDEFSADGQKWIDGTLTCLKQALEPDMLNTDPETCDEV